MKKLILLLGIIVFSVQSVYSADYSRFCAKEPYNLSKGIGSFFSSVTGTNFLITQVAEHEIAKSLKKDLGGKYDVKIKTFGGSNLQNGKFKKLSVKGKNIEKDGMYLSQLEAETVCGFNHIEMKDKQIYFVENMIIKYQGKMTADDLKKVINSDEYKRLLSKLSVTSGGRIFTKILNNEINIVDNKIIMSYDFLYPTLLGYKTKHISFSAGLNVDDGRINFTNIRFGNSIAQSAIQMALPMINMMNPLMFQVRAAKNNDAIVKVSTVKIFNNEILLDGVVIIPKSYKK